MTTITPEDAIRAASSIARDVADGRLTTAALEAQLETELRALVGTVVGEGDPLYKLQCEIARGVLAVGGVPTDELAEWLAVARHRAGEPVNEREPDQTPPEPVALSTVAHSPAPGAVAPGDAEAGVVNHYTQEADTEPDVRTDPPAPVLKSVPTSVAGQTQADGYDPLAGWQPGGTRRS